ncbi:MAG: ribonuclease HII [Acidobacteriota bacterium]
MDEFVARNSTTSATSAVKRRASRKSEKAEKTFRSRAAAGSGAGYLLPLFSELARLAEMSVVERRLRSFGFCAIAGTDEVGRGCLAGPVVAGSVILSEDSLPGLNDSKKLTHGERRRLCRLIARRARAIAVGVVEPHIIDRINILNASKLAMKQSVENLEVRPDVLVLDAVQLESLEMPQLALISGDSRSVSVAAASIVAKFYRDLLMESYHDLYPRYDFYNNRGYGTESHWRALREYGPCPIHRSSFEGVTVDPVLFG